MDVIIVCHTEFGFVYNQQNIFDKKAKQGVEIGIRNLIKITDKYDAKVTFAICPETAEYFPKNTIHEVGLHIHPGWESRKYRGLKWYVGDIYLREHCKQSSNSTVMSDYSYHEQLDMIKTGRDQVLSCLGIETKSFVAGRWSINNDTIKALINSGITHECSATPHPKAIHYDWSKLPRICMPYCPTKTDYQKKGELPIYIIPISQYFPSGNVNPENEFIVGLSWLRACFKEYYQQSVPLFHICLHSPSMTDPHFMSVMDKLLKFISKHKNINFRFVSEISPYIDMKFSTKFSPYIIYGLNKNVIRSFFNSKIRGEAK